MWSSPCPLKYPLAGDISPYLVTFAMTSYSCLFELTGGTSFEGLAGDCVDSKGPVEELTLLP